MGNSGSKRRSSMTASQEMQSSSASPRTASLWLQEYGDPPEFRITPEQFGHCSEALRLLKDKMGDQEKLHQEFKAIEATSKLRKKEMAEKGRVALQVANSSKIPIRKSCHRQ